MAENKGRFTTLRLIDGENQVHNFDLEGQKIQVHQTSQKGPADLAWMDVAFMMTGPVRFPIEVLIPDNCRNACVTLNNQLLIGWFSEEHQACLPEIQTSGCQDHGTPVSTLRPGQFQLINFRWQNQDRLRFYWVR